MSGGAIIFWSTGASTQAVSTGATHCLVAVVLDKTVISAPEIQGVLTGQSQITGQFTSASAKELAEMEKAQVQRKTEIFRLYYTPAANAANVPGSTRLA